jgi:hypothetical protein
MILPQNKFRLLKEYKQHLPINDRTIFAYNDIIYSNYDLPQDLIVHEQEHFKQQKKYGLKNWVKRYLNEKSFRLEMEKEAYLVQLASIPDKGLREAVKKDCIEALSSGLYGKISKEEAEELLATKVKSKVDSLINL